MELFARERQHEPVAMLRDLIRLYCLHYGIDKDMAILMIRNDAQWIKVEPLIEKYG